MCALACFPERALTMLAKSFFVSITCSHNTHSAICYHLWDAIMLCSISNTHDATLGIYDGAAEATTVEGAKTIREAARVRNTPRSKPLLAVGRQVPFVVRPCSAMILVLRYSQKKILIIFLLEKKAAHDGNFWIFRMLRARRISCDHVKTVCKTLLVPL